MDTARYEVRVSDKARKEIDRIPAKYAAKVEAAIEALADNPRPHGSLKLQGRDAYRIRVGDYRIVYTISDRQLLVMVIEVGNRKDIYRG